MSNLLFLDSETTGLNENKNDIIQIACIPVIDGERKHHFNQHCQPINWNNIDAMALSIQRLKLDDLKKFQDPVIMLDNFIKYALSFGVKFGLAGHNVGFFDKRFLFAQFSKLGRQNEFYNIFNLDVRDTMAMARQLKGKIKSENNKLETLAKYFNIEINAHDAMSDIAANIEIHDIMSEMLGENQYCYKAKNHVSSAEFKEPVQLHLHSQYCMLDAIPKPDEWTKWCEDNNVPGFSVVDHGSAISLYYMNKHKSKVRFVPGTGLFFKTDELSPNIYRLNAWAISNEGYFNLMKLSSIGFNTSIDQEGIVIPALTIDQILENRSGLVFGTADIEGYIGNGIRSGQIDICRQRYQYMIDKFGKDLYIEFNPTNITHEFDKKIGFKAVDANPLVTECNLQKAYNNVLFDLLHLGGTPIPVCGASFIDKDDKIVQDCLCKNNLKDGRYHHESQHARTAKELYSGLKDHLGDKLSESMFSSWIENTFTFLSGEQIKVENKYHLPKIIIPQHIVDKTSDYDKQTLMLTMEKIKEYGRWNNSEEYKARFAEEIDVIFKNKVMNFLPYFLIYEDVGKFARNAGFLQNIARGSAGGSLLSYYLNIIHIDPIKNHLPFARFLSHARINAGSWPDIDMDISRSARPHVIKYLKDKYGAGFAQISTFSTMKTKSAIKHAMWALYGRNRNDFEVDALCKTIIDSPQGTTEREFLYGYMDSEGEYHEGEYDRNEQLRNFFTQYSDIKKMVDRLIGVTRGWSRHASAFIISTINLPEARIPTMQMYDKHMQEYIQVSQLDAKMVENSGLVKADILGIATLDFVADALKLIDSVNYLENDNAGVPLIYRLPEDQAVYTDFYNKKTDSSFQFNTNLIKRYIENMAPCCREDLSALTALCRPGTLDAPMQLDPMTIITKKDGSIEYKLDTEYRKYFDDWKNSDDIIDVKLSDTVDTTAAQYFLKVRSGEQELQYLHQDLASILEETNGVILYQEQLMKILVNFCGYSWEQSDQIRSAIAKKKKDVMYASFDQIRQETAKRGWTDKQSQSLCDVMVAYSNYSFNRSHSRGYSELGYITMYLKNHHKLEWWCAVLNNENDEDKLRYFISLLGDLIKSPSLKNPNKLFVIKDGYIISPLSIIKGIGESAFEELSSKGPFIDLKDYCSRINHTKVNIGAISQIVKARAADDFFDEDLSYGEARQKFMKDYMAIRKIRTRFKEELYNDDALHIYLMEKEANKVFNKSIISDQSVLVEIMRKWPGFTFTGKQAIPLKLGDTLVLSSARVAEGLLDRGYQEEVGMILLYDGSETKAGNSKRTGRPWSKLDIKANDGFINMEVTDWNRNKALKWPINSIIFVKGKIQKGWQTNICINVSEIEIIQ